MALVFSFKGVKNMISFFKSIKARLDRRAVRIATIKELQKLSNRELNDIGISRCDIPYLASQV